MLPPELVNKIKRIKGLGAQTTLFSIPIRRHEGEPIGTFRPVDVVLGRQSYIIERLTAWRRTYMRYFLTQFDATPERTSTWIEGVVLPSDDRVLFLIFDDKNSLIGNFSVCNLSQDEAELDNLIRGEIGGDRLLIFYSEVSLLSWLFWSIGVQKVCLHVFSNNKRTINLHTRVGFRLGRVHRLSKVHYEDGIRYLLDSDDGEYVGFEYLEMIMTRNEFCSSQPWAEAIYADFKVNL